ncbi:MAG: TetR/AcrR family transcriptional regulator [Candidatus Dormibacteria bacterium]
MVKAAYAVFCSQGFSVPLTTVAAEAGVAVQTLYFTFHNKTTLLKEAHDYAVLGDSNTPPDQSAWFEAMERETDMRRAVELMLAGTREIFERIGPLLPVLQAAATGDPEIAGFLADREGLRVDGYRRLIAMLARKGGLRPELSESEATDLALVLCGPDVFRLTTAGRGWSSDEWQQRIARVLGDALLGP